MLKFRKPIVAGDKLYCGIYVDSVREAHGRSSPEHRHQREGDYVQETYTALAGRAGEDGEGFLMALREFSSVRSEASFRRDLPAEARQDPGRRAGFRVT